MQKHIKPEDSKTRQTVYVAAYWILLAAIWFYSLSLRPLVAPDEGRYASIALEMLRSGDWITPRLNGFLYFEKPVLQYWAGAASFALFGVNEFAARFWPGLTGFLTVIVVWLTAKRLWGGRVGHFAALGVFSSLWTIGNSHFLSLDMGASFFLTLSLCGFLVAQQDSTMEEVRRRFMWLCWAAMGGAVLSKGLIGILIPGATLVLYSLISRHWTPWRRMYWLSGLTIFFAIAVPWFYLVSERNPGFAHFFFIHEHFERFLTTTHRREGPFWYFVPILLVGLFPWSSLLGRIVNEGCQRSESPFNGFRVLLIWCAFVFVFFSASSSKLPSYILPIFPALGMLLALVLDKIPAAMLKRHLVLMVTVAVMMICAFPFAGHFASENSPLPILRHLALYLVIAGGVYLVGAYVAWRALNKDCKTFAVMAIALASILAFSVIAIGHAPYSHLKSAKGIVETIGPYLRPDTQIFSVKSYNQTFPYYLGRSVTLVEYVDEFDFGEKAEPSRWIPTVDEFVPRWNSADSALAMMSFDTYEVLSKRNLPMRVVYQGARSMVVAKP
jgi:4-amino-4-deoxy-L-arabinose transferase-like glycosyltransferase